MTLTSWFKVAYYTFLIANNKDADQTARIHRLICAFDVSKQPSGFLASRPNHVNQSILIKEMQQIAETVLNSLFLVFSCQFDKVSVKQKC